MFGTTEAYALDDNAFSVVIDEGLLIDDEAFEDEETVSVVNRVIVSIGTDMVMVVVEDVDAFCSEVYVESIEADQPDELPAQLDPLPENCWRHVFGSHQASPISHHPCSLPEFVNVALKHQFAMY